MKTIYQINSAPDDSVALSAEDVEKAIEQMKECGEEWDDYDIEILSSKSSNRTNEDGDYALEYEIPDEWMPELLELRAAGSLTWWSEMVAFAESKGHEETFDGNKFGSWDYKFIPEQTDED